MATIKIEFSLEDTICVQIDQLAKELGISRSQLIALTTERYLAQHQNQQLLNAINDAYDVAHENDEYLLSPLKEKQYAVVDEW